MVNPIAVNPAPVATAEAPPVKGIAAKPASANAPPVIFARLALFFFFFNSSATAPVQ